MIVRIRPEYSRRTSLVLSQRRRIWKVLPESRDVQRYSSTSLRTGGLYSPSRPKMGLMVDQSLQLGQCQRIFLPSKPQ